MITPANQIYWLRALAVCMVLLFILQIAGILLTSLSNSRTNREMAMMAKVSIGMTRSECDFTMGPPQQVFAAGTPVSINKYLHQTIAAKGVTYFYDFFPLAIIVYFDQEGRCYYIDYVRT